MLYAPYFLKNKKIMFVYFIKIIKLIVLNINVSMFILKIHHQKKKYIKNIKLKTNI